MTTSGHTSWRRLAVLPLVLVVAGVGVLNGAGWLIDSSSLDQGEDSWGYAFGAFFLSVYATPVLAVVLGSAVVGWATRQPGVRQGSAWLGAAVCVVPAAFLATIAVGSASGRSAEVVFGLVSFAIGLVLLVPAGLCARLTVRQRASAAAS
jgi:hypothetical protein